MIEIFKDIEGYENLYQISNLGNVKSLGNGNSNNSKEKILKPTKNKKGYLTVGLYKDGKLKRHKIHRLVAQAFIDNPNNLPQINHRDEDKTNNHFTNLEWCDTKYNINYGTRNERSATNRINHPKRSKQLMCVETGVVYSSTMEVERQLGYFQTHIASVCRGKHKTAYKFHWCYV